MIKKKEESEKKQKRQAKIRAKVKRLDKKKESKSPEISLCIVNICLGGTCFNLNNTHPKTKQEMRFFWSTDLFYLLFVLEI